MYILRPFWCYCPIGIFFLILLFQPLTMAEYRVFVLKISRAPATIANAADKPAPPAPSPTQSPTPPSKIVQSTLDPEQYLGYFPLEKGESIVYVDTWKCPGRTGDFQSLCQRSSARPSSKLPTAP